MTDAALATSVPPRLRRPGPGGAEAGPAWRAACMASWPAPGWRILTVNRPEEIVALGDVPAAIERVTAGTSGPARGGAPVDAAIAAALATGAPIVGLVNADIHLDLDALRREALLAAASEAMLLCNRMDVVQAGQREGPFYRYGYDIVLMPRAIATRLDLAGFAFGVPWWDYWIALDALLQDLPVRAVQCRGMRHLQHAAAWHRPDWRRGLGELLARLPPRRAAVAGLGLSPVGTRLAELLIDLAPTDGGGYAVDEMLTVAGTRFGIEVVRLVERDAWRLD